MGMYCITMMSIKGASGSLSDIISKILNPKLVVRVAEDDVSLITMVGLVGKEVT